MLEKLSSNTKPGQIYKLYKFWQKNEKRLGSRYKLVNGLDDVPLECVDD